MLLLIDLLFSLRFWEKGKKKQVSTSIFLLNVGLHVYILLHTPEICEVGILYDITVCYMFIWE